jgi:hypothetical protein
MTFAVAVTMPSGYRPMSEIEIRRLAWGAIVAVLDTHTGHVENCTAMDARDGSVVVKFRGGHLATLGAADTDEQFVPVVPQLADEIEDPNNALAVALRASNKIAKLEGRIRQLEEALKRQADAILGMPTRADYDAIAADIHQLQQDYRALRLSRAS